MQFDEMIVESMIQVILRRLARFAVVVNINEQSIRRLALAVYSLITMQFGENIVKSMNQVIISKTFGTIFCGAYSQWPVNPPIGVLAIYANVSMLFAETLLNRRFRSF